MVRLKYLKSVDGAESLASFQFLYGTIKIFVVYFLYFTFVCFNSYMVRLKSMQIFKVHLHSFGFNSYMVRLKYA